MSTAGISSHHRSLKNTFHRRNNSGELDVFEAARYFSTTHDPNPGPTVPSRMSLDMPTIMRGGPIIAPDFRHGSAQKLPESENKKPKQPSSPGGRLASFLNSLFNQTPLKKKKKSKPGKDFDDENAANGTRRKRRSSISHFRIITTNAAGDNNNNNNNNNHSVKSGLRTPPPYTDTPTKSYKTISMMFRAERKGEDFVPWAKKREARELEFPDWKSPEARATAKSGEADDGGDSDSSSDLFDLDFYSSGLPVYETTQMDRIKIVAPV